uniref:cell wall hydrolase n=1 Tax=Pseudomonas laurentiana TaxID=2364649 RepID=UPI0029C97741|nr:cell wall hydrolase [Pseudomonas laurentiana]
MGLISIVTATCFAVILLSAPAVAADLEQDKAATVDKAQALEQKAAANKSTTSLPEAATLTKPEAQAVDPVGTASLDNAISCLARTIYWEAKGGAPSDMEAVASVVLNRVGHEGFPGTVCEVVKQGSEQHACQFSWWCDGQSDHVDEDAPYLLAKEVARKALNQQLTDRTGGALYFHSKGTRPDWAKQYTKTAETGKFLFYKPHNGTAR